MKGSDESKNLVALVAEKEPTRTLRDRSSSSLCLFADGWYS